MELIAFRVCMYKGIIDSGWVDVNDLTVLVGKNESGKTSLLKALHKLNPDPSESYDIETEWPRGRRNEKDQEHAVCRVKFRLSNREKSSLSRYTSLEKMPNVVEVSRNYAGGLDVKFEEEIFSDKPQVIDINRLLEALPRIEDRFSVPFRRRAERCLKETFNSVREEGLDGLRGLDVKHDLYLSEALSPADPERQFEINFISLYRRVIQNFVREFERGSSIQAKVHRYITSRLPTFLYLDDYRIFSGTARLNEIQSRRDEDHLTEVDKTFLSILNLSKLDLDELIRLGQDNEQKVAQRFSDLQQGAATLTAAFSSHLSQRKYVVEYDINNNLFLTFIKDNLDSTPIRLEERSRGFQWFFSFDLMFMHGSNNTLKGSVILLDEPGLHLHPEAQGNLLSLLEEYAKNNTLLYTTHLPFMIDLNHPNRIRILKETKEGIVVTDDFTVGTKKSKFVLEGALGLKAAQSYLVAKRNLVVEGVDDYWILTELSNLLQEDGKEGLPEDVKITPGGGASKAVYIATFMIGQDLGVVALFDSDKEGQRAQKNLVHSWIAQCRQPRAEAILLGDAVGVKGDFALEDLFTEEFYMECVKETYPEADGITLQTQGTLWKRVEKALKDEGIEKPNKESISKRLRRKLSRIENISELHAETRKKTIMFFQTMGKAFEKIKPKSS